MKDIKQYVDIIINTTIERAGSVDNFQKESLTNHKNSFNVYRWFNTILERFELERTRIIANPQTSQITDFSKLVDGVGQKKIYYNCTNIRLNCLYPYIIANEIPKNSWSYPEFSDILDSLIKYRKTTESNEERIIVKIFINYVYGLVTSNKINLYSSIDIKEFIQNYVGEILAKFWEHDKFIYHDTDEIFINDTVENVRYFVERLNLPMPYELVQCRSFAYFKNKQIIVDRG